MAKLKKMFALNPTKLGEIIYGRKTREYTVVKTLGKNERGYFVIMVKKTKD